MIESMHLIWILVLSVAVSMGSGPWVIPFLKRLKIGQSIRDEGPQSHQVKSGTPTMGGIIIFIGFVIAVVSVLLIAGMPDRRSATVIVGLLGFGLIGFVDDYIKVVMKRNLGLRAWQKIVGQIAVSLAVTLLLMPEGTDIMIPGIEMHLNLGWFYAPFSVFILVATTNGVNLTDGLDGLAGGVTTIVMGFFALAAWTMGMPMIAALSLGIMGGCIGFLKYNMFPAKVFMGDTGSLALGGVVATVALALKLPLFIPLVGMIYLAETMSVMIQVTSFKSTGKRVFRMAPLHHHYELGGWKETKVVRVFWAVTAVMAVVSYLLI